MNFQIKDKVVPKHGWYGCGWSDFRGRSGFWDRSGFWSRPGFCGWGHHHKESNGIERCEIICLIDLFFKDSQKSLKKRRKKTSICPKNKTNKNGYFCSDLYYVNQERLWLTLKLSMPTELAGCSCVTLNFYVFEQNWKSLTNNTRNIPVCPYDVADNEMMTPYVIIMYA